MKTKSKIEAAYILSLTGENIIKYLTIANNQVDSEGYTVGELLALETITKGLQELCTACLQAGLNEIKGKYND